MKEKRRFHYFVLWCFAVISIIMTGCGGSAGDTELMISEKESSGAEDGQETVSSGRIYVYVCGEVKNPGVYETYAGARLYEVIELAGGMKDSAAKEYLNLAREVADGEQVDVLSVDEYERMSFAADESGESDDGLVNINTATAEELTALPGIGDVKAEAIVAYREANGGFDSIEDIMNVDGIKEGSFTKIQGLIKVK